MVLKTDPVTFTADEAGWYAVHVSANDVAVTGARPAWFQAAVLLPPGATATTARRIFRQVDAACRSLGVALTGGHTEVTPAVRQPVVVGDMHGVLLTRRAIATGGARPGDLIVLTKFAALEGTAILARACYAALRRRVRGLREASQLHHRPGISVVAEALCATASGASAMHDPTEGGVAAGLHELAAASQKRIVVDLDRIPTLPVTEAICRTLRVDPLRLISSGALLIAIAPRRWRRLANLLARRKIPAREIGRVENGRGVSAYRAGRRVRMAWSAQDELARIL